MERPFNANFEVLRQTTLPLQQGNGMVIFIFQEENGRIKEVGWNERNGRGWDQEAIGIG